MEGALAEPALAAQDQAGGMVRTRPWGSGRRVTVFALLGHPVASAAGVIAVVRVRWSWRAMYRFRERPLSLGFFPSAGRGAGGGAVADQRRALGGGGFWVAPGT